MKVDYFLLGSSMGAVGEMAREAERLGFDGVLSADTTHDSFLPLAIAAETTDRVELGTAITVAFARSPMTVAYSTWDLADLSGGRFILGLGTQIKAHITRRFSMPWETPAARLKEYIRALRAIWESWQTGERLNFVGEYYSFTLMTPFFNPGPIKDPDVPIYISAVNPLVSRVAGELCQGIHVHPFHTVRYLREVVFPNVERGAAPYGRSLDDVDMAAAVIVVSGRDDDEIAASTLAAKQQIAFYASTPAYRGISELHGWDFAAKATAMSKRGQWAEMAALVTDEALHEVAVVAPLDEVGLAVRDRYDGVLQRMSFYAIPPFTDLSEEEWSPLVDSVQD